MKVQTHTVGVLNSWFSGVNATLISQLDIYNSNYRGPTKPVSLNFRNFKMVSAADYKLHKMSRVTLYLENAIGFPFNIISYLNITS